MACPGVQTLSLGSPGKVPFVAPASSGDPGSLMQAERAAVKQSSRIYDIFSPIRVRTRFGWRGGGVVSGFREIKEFYFKWGACQS